MVPGNVFVFYMQLLKHCPVDDLSLSTKMSVKETARPDRTLALSVWLCCFILFVIFHAIVDGAGAVDLFRQYKAGQLVRHRDASHGQLCVGGFFYRIRQPVG